MATGALLQAEEIGQGIGQVGLIHRFLDRGSEAEPS